MTIEEIVALAREAISEEPYAEVVVPFGGTVWMMDSVLLERFAVLVAAHEREACADLCEGRYGEEQVARAIRARGE